MSSDRAAEGRRGASFSNLAEPQRQSLLGLLFGAVGLVRNFSGVNVAVLATFIFARQFSTVLMVALVVGLVAAVGWSALAWWKFVFSVNGDQLVVRRGVLAEERLVIPLDRIQSVSIEQTALHRVVGLVKVAVETAGASSVEFEIDAVSASVARSLQQVAQEHGARHVGPVSSSSDPPPENEVLVSRTSNELVTASLSRLPLAGLVGLGSLAPFAGQIVRRVESLDLTSSPFLLGGAATIVALVLWFLDVAQEIVRNWGLTISRSRVGLQRSAGMFSRTTKSTTVERIQSMTTTENVVERHLGIRRVTLRTIGSGDLHIIGGKAAELERLRLLVLGSRSAITADRSVSRWFIYKELRSVPLLIVGLVVAWFVTRSPFVLVGMTAVLWLSVRAAIRWRFLRWGFDEGKVILSTSLLARRTVEQRLVTFQQVTVLQSWLERRRGLATLVFASAENRVVVPMIGSAEAQEIRDRVLLTLATDHSPWI